jgi:hypothetical protein
VFIEYAFLHTNANPVLEEQIDLQVKVVELQVKTVELESEEVIVPSLTVMLLGVNLPYRGNRTHAFSNVDPIYKRSGKHYWEYLKLRAMEVYGKV